jgi:linoleoyl-CoA desaturase
MQSVGTIPSSSLERTQSRATSNTPHSQEVAPPSSATSPPGRLKFARDSAGFLNALKQRVAEYFTQTGKRPNDNWRMYLKSAIILAWFFGSYIALVFFAKGALIAIPLAFFLALSMAAVGFGIQHDGGHNAYSRKNWINKLAASTLDLIGASSYLWYWKHAIFHHSYTNIQNHDPDIDLGSAGRFSPHAKKFWFQRWQHIYLWPLYGLMSSRWHIIGDFKDVVNGTIPPHRVPRPKGWALIVFIAGKVISFSMAFAIPLFFHSWWVVLLFYLLVTGVLGIVLSLVFQLAHCVEEADFPLPSEGTQRMEQSWAVHQMETTVNFARESKILCWYLGGLNFQIEHHIFPHVCHIHYPAISRIVESTCREFGVRYSVHPTFWAGMKSHYRWLKRMGAPDPKSPTPTPTDGGPMEPNIAVT